MSEHIFAREALLNPQLTLALPPRVTAITGMDALVDAIESLAGDPGTSSRCRCRGGPRGCQRNSRPDNGLRRRP